MNSYQMIESSQKVENHLKNVADYREEIGLIEEEIEGAWDRGDRSFVKSAESRIDELKESIRYEEKLTLEESLRIGSGVKNYG
jgi:hypothetical protein